MTFLEICQKLEKNTYGTTKYLLTQDHVGVEIS